MDILKASRNALWFTSNRTKMVALSRAIAAGNEPQIRKAADQAVRFVSNPKAKRILVEALSKKS
jgi:hypothetical protein